MNEDRYTEEERDSVIEEIMEGNEVMVENEENKEDVVEDIMCKFGVEVMVKETDEGFLIKL